MVYFRIILLLLDGRRTGEGGPLGTFSLLSPTLRIGPEEGEMD